MRLFLFFLLISFSYCILAQQDTAVSWFDKARKMPLDSLDSYQFSMLRLDFNGKNLEEAKPVFDSLPRKTDENVLYQKRTMCIVQLRSMPNLSNHEDGYGIFTDDFLKNPSNAQFEEAPYYPGDYEPVELFRSICDNVSEGTIRVSHKDGSGFYSIEEFENEFYYDDQIHMDSTGEFVLGSGYWNKLPPTREWVVYNYVVIEDWICDSNLNFYSEIVAIAPLRIEYGLTKSGYSCYENQTLLFWIFF